ncbi:MAG: hypothetical protein M0Z92_09405 [Actinomycetota bacterium]|jgi:hypothetical protein|nr:hypothetical protein [Actinomycetota bacterium]MDA8373031.1 hypothetical protein [Actinomycetota bacterium]
MTDDRDVAAMAGAHGSPHAAGEASPIPRERQAALLHCGMAMLVCSGLPQPSLAEFLR